MVMAENKTKPTQASVGAFLEALSDEQKKKDCFLLLERIKDITGEKPVLWGPSIIGFGSYHYKYDTGREGDMILTGFSPRAQNISIYIMAGFERYPQLMKKLGKYRTGKSCLYVKRLSDIDLDVLMDLVSASYEHMNAKYNS